MSDTAEKADRTPNWNKWRLTPKLTVRQCAALWANIDPDKLCPSPYGGGFDESREFEDRLHLVEANLYGALKCKGHKVDRRLFGAWVRKAQEAGWDAPAELLAMADEHETAAWEGFDPTSDTYPPELDIALQAWRAATNRRDSSKTAKEQIREWLGECYPKLSEEAKGRIAVVCNWEKGGGKPRRE